MYITPADQGESVHQQIARHIGNEIAAGVRRDGDVLPPSREMAAEWDASTFTITSAMKLLEAEGFIEGKSRSKRVVRVPNQERRGPVRLRSDLRDPFGSHIRFTRLRA